MGARAGSAARGNLPIHAEPAADEQLDRAATRAAGSRPGAAAAAFLVGDNNRAVTIAAGGESGTGTAIAAVPGPAAGKVRVGKVGGTARARTWAGARSVSLAIGVDRSAGLDLEIVGHGQVESRSDRLAEEIVAD